MSDNGPRGVTYSATTKDEEQRCEEMTGNDSLIMLLSPNLNIFNNQSYLLRLHVQESLSPQINMSFCVDIGCKCCCLFT